MTLPGGGYQGSNMGKANVDAFIPEIWSGEVKRELDAALILKDIVSMTSFNGKQKGDTIHIPVIKRLAVNDKVYNTPVTLQNQTADDFQMTIDKYKEVSFMVEDIANLFASGQYNVRQEYTREAGYALARDLDNYLLGLRAAIQNYSDQVIYNTNNGLPGGTYQALNEASILAAMQILDEANVPREGRYLIVSPGQYTDLLTIDRFSSFDYVDTKAVPNGYLGNIYGVTVKMSTQLSTNSLTGYTNGEGGAPQPTPGVTGSPYLPTQDSFTSLPYNGDGTASQNVVSAIMAHKDFAKLGVPQQLKTEVSREALFQADAVINTMIYGGKLYRPDHAVLIHTLA